MRMKFRFVTKCMMALVSASLFAQASYAADAPQPPGLLETYLCNYNPGQERGDLLAARDNLIKQSKKEGLALQDSFVWDHIKGASPNSMMWHSIYPSIDDWAAQSDASAGNAVMAGVLARFNDVATCRAVIGAVRVVHAQEQQSSSTQSFVTTSACSAKHGVTPVDVTDFTGHLGEVLKGMGDDAPNMVIHVTPINTAPDVPDDVIFAVHDNASAWVNFTKKLQSGNASLGRHFQATFDCSFDLWGSEQVIDAG